LGTHKKNRVCFHLLRVHLEHQPLLSRAPGARSVEERDRISPPKTKSRDVALAKGIQMYCTYTKSRDVALALGVTQGGCSLCVERAKVQNGRGAFWEDCNFQPACRSVKISSIKVDQHPQMTSVRRIDHLPHTTVSSLVEPPPEMSENQFRTQDKLPGPVRKHTERWCNNTASPLPQPRLPIAIQSGAVQNTVLFGACIALSLSCCSYRCWQQANLSPRAIQFDRPPEYERHEPDAGHIQW